MESVALSIALLLASGIRISTPLILGTLGESLTERAGLLNLGVEGMMMLGASTSYLIALRTGSVFLSLLGGLLAGLLGALIYAFLTVSMRANQTVTGLALTIFGVGFGNTLGKLGAGANVPELVVEFFRKSPFSLAVAGGKPGPVLSFINAAFLEHNFFVYLAIALAILMYIFLFKTRYGLNVRAVGESAPAADAAGLPVAKIQYGAVLVGGGLAGLAGSYYPLANIGTWSDGITSGRGWIVVALVIFIRWHPIKAIFGSFLFGLLDVIGFRLPTLLPQVADWPIFSEYAFNMYPYIMTIIVLILSSTGRRKIWPGPAGLGRSYFREER